jgi:tRNA(Ser,Leu) C12 N-acetylase TAN1
MKLVTKPMTLVKGWLTPVPSKNYKDVTREAGISVDLDLVPEDIKLKLHIVQKRVQVGFMKGDKELMRATVHYVAIN